MDEAAKQQVDEPKQTDDYDEEKFGDFRWLRRDTRGELLSFLAFTSRQRPT
jgi:hypothetical protein